jgi:hypothetical protein
MTHDKSRRILINGKARMTNDEGMTKSEAQKQSSADDSVWKKDFLKSIGTCRKEARETKHFLRMVARAVPELKLQARELWMEARELHLKNLERPEE